MNASKILQQLMSQASGSKGSSGGMDVKGVIDGLSRHLGGNSSQGTRQSSGSSGFDVKSLLGGGALGILVGSKRGRSMGGKALKYGAIAGVGVLAWKAWQSSQEKKGAATQSSSEGERVEVLSGEVQERRSLELLQALPDGARRQFRRSGFHGPGCRRHPHRRRSSRRRWSRDCSGNPDAHDQGPYRARQP